MEQPNIFMSYLRVTQHMSQQFRSHFGRLDLTFPQALVLTVLGEDGPVPISALAERTGSANSTVSGIVDRLEKLGLAPDDAAHDALHDARSTAQIAARLDLDKGIAGYRDATSALLCADVLASAGFRGLADPATALEGAVGEIPCPVCGQPLERGEWVEQNGEKRIAMAVCPEHGRFFVRLKLWRTGKTFSARRTLCRPDEQIDAFYREKALRARQRAEKRRADGATGEQAGEN